MLKEYGLIVISEFEFPDHYNYTEKDIDKILDQAKNLNCKIITTEKDFERLKNLKTDNIQYIKSELKIFDEEKFIKSVI
jgi:tetraacyldisaccharide 4'-kinase